MSERLPLKQGKEWAEKRIIQPAPQMSPAKYSLSDLRSDYHFFNHGALFRYGGLKFPDEDPLNDWYSQRPKGTIVLRELFNAKLFDGLLYSWDHTICAVKHEDWNDLWAFLCGTAIVDRKLRKYREVFSGELEILDPVLIERFSVFDERSERLVPVTLFGIDGNDHRWEPRPPTRVEHPVRFIELPPRQKVTDMAALVLDGDVSKLQSRSNQALDAIVREAQQDAR